MPKVQLENVFVSESGQSLGVVGAVSNEAGEIIGGGVVEATEHEPGHWYLNRSLVNPRIARGAGLGTLLLRRLLEELGRKPSFREVVVEPGGYDGNAAQQQNFYVKAGFVEVPDLVATFRWTKPESTDEQANAS